MQKLFYINLIVLEFRERNPFAELCFVNRLNFRVDETQVAHHPGICHHRPSVAVSCRRIIFVRLVLKRRIMIHCFHTKFGFLKGFKRLKQNITRFAKPPLILNDFFRQRRKNLKILLPLLI